MSKATTSSQLELLALKSANYTDKKVAALAESIIAAIEALPDPVRYDEAQTLTEAQKAQARANIGAIDRGQVKPEFANSVEECTDTSKMYVLPDGYIWAYMVTKVQQGGYTNLADPSSADWLTGKRFSTSSISDAANGIITNYITCKKGDTVRVKGLNMLTAIGGSAPRIRTYNGATVVDGGALSFSLLVNNANNGSGTNGDINTIILTEGDHDVTNGEINKGFNRIRLNGTLMSGYTANDIIITVNEEIREGAYVDAYAWANTGLAFVPADYEDRIIDLENETENHETRIKLLEANEDEKGVPSYWLSELETKADTIQQAVETAGRNKSAFLWYTDAHWTSSAKISPALLKYLAKNTPINKVNFGGDIVGDPSSFTHDNVKYVYEWRKLIADLPNHHSVYGNHDVNQRSTDVGNIAYALLLAPEETPDMVIGGDSYYYIDNPAEKTRYLYLSYLSDASEKTAQGTFIVNAISSVNNGWHIVVIAHRWWQYNSSSNPTDGYVMQYETEILNLFDKYNARGAYTASTFFSGQNFANAKGKVEFCIGGHIHVDYDFKTDGGIPVIITTADTNQNRVPDSTVDSGTVGTITEAAVFGIIADYNDIGNTKITVVGVGRGTSRIVRAM